MHKDFDKHYQTAYIVASRSYGVGGDNNEDAKQRAEAARLSQATAQITRIISVLDDLKAQTDDKRDVTETCLKLLGLRKDDLSTGPDSLGEESEITPLERCRLQYRLVAAMIHPLEGGRGIPGASRAFGAVRDAFRSLVEPLGGTPKSEWRQPWERLLLGEEQGRILERGEQAA